MERIDKLTSKVDELSASLSDVAKLNFEETKMGKTFNTLTHLLLTSTAYNLNETLTPQPVIVQSSAPLTPNVQTPSSQPVTTQEGTQTEPVVGPPPPSDEPSLLKPSKLFKKLNR